MLTKFIHFTDTHLVAPGELLKGLDPQQRFAACIDDIIKHHGDAVCCVMTGDVADLAHREAYELFASEIERCGLPCYPMLGNHDDRNVFIKCLADVPIDENGFVQYEVKTPAGVFLLLDTVERGAHNGEYCQARQDWLSSRLQLAGNEPVYLFMHHPPFDLHLPCIDRIGLKQQQEFAAIVAAHNNIRHLFFGHAHRALSGNWNGISFSSLRGTNHQVGLNFKGQTIAYVDERPEYAVVFLSDNQLVVHTHSYPLPS